MLAEKLGNLVFYKIDKTRYFKTNIILFELSTTKKSNVWPIVELIRMSILKHYCPSFFSSDLNLYPPCGASSGLHRQHHPIIPVKLS